MELCCVCVNIKPKIPTFTFTFTFTHHYSFSNNLHASSSKSLSFGYLSNFKITTKPHHKLSCVSRQVKSKNPKRRASSPPPAVAGESKLERLPADLKVTEAPEPNSRIRLTVEVPEKVCSDSYRKVIAQLMKTAEIRGFQRGKVPEDILIRHVGEKEIQQATIESVLKRTLPHSMSALTDKALRDSVRIVSRFPDMLRTYSTQKSFSYDIVVDVAPEIKWISEDAYKNLKIVVEIDSDVNAQVAADQEFRRRHKSLGVMKIVTDRGLEIGDVAVLDISATTDEEDETKVEKIPAAESKGFHFDTEDSDKLLPGFLESISGMKHGETKTFPLAFPDSWKQEHLRGVRAKFTVECKELFYRDLPELDDSLAEKLLPGCTTLQQVKELLLLKYQEAEENAREQATDNAILDQLCKMVEIDIPQSVFEEQGRQLYGSTLLQIQANMKLSEEQLASLSSPKAVKEYLEGQKDNIQKVIKQNMAVGDIFKRENLGFSSAELMKEVENSIAEFKRHKQEYDEERVKDQVQEIMEGAKVLEWLREHAEIQCVTR
ncbi:hypothetical protein ACFE04_006923 [Oxalis oulophora]